mgnify:CR=1 FL=1
MRNLVPKTFDSVDFAVFCAKDGVVELDGKKYTLLTAPMPGFYQDPTETNPGRTQLRIAYVEPETIMRLVPKLFADLLDQYLK